MLMKRLIFYDFYTRLSNILLGILYVWSPINSVYKLNLYLRRIEVIQDNGAFFLVVPHFGRVYLKQKQM